jgi:hypothetical protein
MSTDGDPLLAPIDVHLLKRSDGARDQRLQVFPRRRVQNGIAG